MAHANAYAYTWLKRIVKKAGEGDERYTQQELEHMVYARYEKDKITTEEYAELCDLLESIV